MTFIFGKYTVVVDPVIVLYIAITVAAISYAFGYLNA